MSQLDWLSARTIYLTNHGSRAYGTSLPTSDHDVRGIVIPPKVYFYGFLHHFEQTQSKKDDVETVLFDLRKFMKLAADGNPNVLEILFVHPEDRLVVTPVGQRLLDHREMFLSKKIKHTFSGYAVSQLKRIQTHRKWLLDPPQRPLTRQEFGLPERTLVPADQLATAASLIRKKVESWDIDVTYLDDASKIQLQAQLTGMLADMQMAHESDQQRVAGKLLGFSDNFLEVLENERKYAAAQRNWEQYQNWLHQRNPARATLEVQHGYDTKHAMHLVRLMRTCKEVLETGCLHVRRPDAKELLEIRNGAWTYENLLAWAEKQEQELTTLYEKSDLPRTPNFEKLDTLCIELIEQMGL